MDNSDDAKLQMLDNDEHSEFSFNGGIIENPVSASNTLKPLENLEKSIDLER